MVILLIITLIPMSHAVSMYIQLKLIYGNFFAAIAIAVYVCNKISSNKLPGDRKERKSNLSMISQKKQS